MMLTLDSQTEAYLVAPRLNLPRHSTAEHECFFRSLVEHTFDLVTVVNERGQILYKSPSAEHHLGCRANYLIGGNLFDHIHPDDDAKVRAAFEECVRLDTPSAPVEHRIRHEDGGWRRFESVGRFHEDRIAGRIGVIHSRRIADRRTAILHDRSFPQTAGLSTTAIAHDINNLVGVISAHAAMLAEESSPTARESAHEVQQAAERVADLASKLMVMSTGGAGPRIEETCDANAAIADLEPLLARLAGKNVEVTCALGAVPSRVALDASAIDQVLVNLVVNAKEAMPQGGTLTITTSNRSLWGAHDRASANSSVDCVVIDVTDGGRGMTDAVKARIFEPFFTTKAPGRNSGIGLYTVARVVHEAGGMIEVISAPGQGATFRVLLPLVR